MINHTKAKSRTKKIARQHKRHEHAILAGSEPPSKTKVEKIEIFIG
jgi:hypothetical protein